MAFKKKNPDLPELKRQIKEDKLKPIYLFFGTETYLKETYIKSIREKVPDNGFEEFNYITLKGTDVSLSEYDDAWESFPMMADRKLVYISGSNIFKSATEDQKEFWKEKFSRCADDMIVIFDETSVDKRSILYKALTKNGMAVEFETPDEADLVTYIMGQCLKAQKKIKKENAYQIVTMCDEGLQNIMNELNKLFDYCGEEITKTDIERIVSKGVNIRIFELTDGIMNHDAKRAMEVITDLRNSNESAFGILYLIYANVKKILKAKLNDNADPKAVARALGTSDFIAKKYISSAAGFSEGALTKMVLRIPEIDYEIKQGKTDEWTALEQYVAEALYYA